MYPRSFKDSNGDGIGDIKGIIEKIDYIAKLGVDAIWVSPFFQSPMKDFGYDISDYRAVDPIFGSLQDFDELILASKGRDGCRTPIVWDAQKPFGDFSRAGAWLPLANEHFSKCVNAQQRDPNSVLRFYQTFLKWLAKQIALRWGQVRMPECSNTNILLIERHIDLTEPNTSLERADSKSANSQYLLGVFNLSNVTQSTKLAVGARADSFDTRVTSSENCLELAPDSFAYFSRVKNSTERKV